MEIEVSKDNLAVFTENLVAKYLVVFQDVDGEESHYDIDGDHQALADEIFKESDDATLVLYQRKGDVADRWSGDFTGYSDDFRLWLRKDVGEIRTRPCNDTHTNEQLLVIESWADGIEVSSFLTEMEVAA